MITLPHHVKQALREFRSVMNENNNQINDVVLTQNNVPMLTLALAKQMLGIYAKDYDKPADDVSWLLTQGFQYKEENSSYVYTLGPIKYDVSKKTECGEWWCGFFSLPHVKTRQDVANLKTALNLDCLTESGAGRDDGKNRDLVKDQIPAMSAQL